MLEELISIRNEIVYPNRKTDDVVVLKYIKIGMSKNEALKFCKDNKFRYIASLTKNEVDKYRNDQATTKYDERVMLRYDDLFHAYETYIFLYVYEGKVVNASASFAATSF